MLPQTKLFIAWIIIAHLMVAAIAEYCNSPYRAPCRAENNLEEFKPGCCRPCRSCHKGRGKPSNVTAEERCKSGCINCVPGKTYNDKPQSYDCKACQTCDPNREILANCTRFSNTKCGPCKPGFYVLPGHPACIPCIKHPQVHQPVECREFFEKESKILALTTMGIVVENVTDVGTSPATITSSRGTPLRTQDIQTLFVIGLVALGIISVVTALVCRCVKRKGDRTSERIDHDNETITVRGEHIVVYTKIPSKTDLPQACHSRDSGLGTGALNSANDVSELEMDGSQGSGHSENPEKSRIFWDSRGSRNSSISGGPSNPIVFGGSGGSKNSFELDLHSPSLECSSSNTPTYRKEPVNGDDVQEYVLPRFTSGTAPMKNDADPWDSSDFTAKESEQDGEIRTPVQETVKPIKRTPLQEDGKSPDEHRPTPNTEPHI